MGEDQHEAAEIDHAVAVFRFVELHVHVTGEAAGDGGVGLSGLRAGTRGGHTNEQEAGEQDANLAKHAGKRRWKFD